MKTNRRSYGECVNGVNDKVRSPRSGLSSAWGNSASFEVDHKLGSPVKTETDLLLYVHRLSTSVTLWLCWYLVLTCRSWRFFVLPYMDQSKPRIQISDISHPPLPSRRSISRKWSPQIPANLQTRAYSVKPYLNTISYTPTSQKNNRRSCNSMLWCGPRWYNVHAFVSGLLYTPHAIER